MMYLSGLGRRGRIEKKRMPVKLVIDASVALKWQFKDESETEAAIRMLEDFVGGRVLLISPSLFAYEIVSAINIAVLKGRISEKDAIDIIKDSLNIGIELVDFAGLEEKTFKMARRHNRSVYDCAYLSLAERERCNIFTADKHLYNALNDKVPFIRWIGNYSSSHY